MNKYLKQRMMKSDHRNPYGSKGGYVDSYGRDNAMDHRQYDSRDNNEYDGYGYHFHGNPKHMQPGAYQMYAQVTPQMYDSRGSNNDYRNRDYNYEDDNYERDYHHEDPETKFKKEMHHFKNKLKENAKYNISDEELIKHAKQMGVQFDKYSEEDLIVTYYMLMCEYPLDLLNNPQVYIVMAKHFLESKKSKYKGTDKLAAYYYEIVLGGEE